MDVIHSSLILTANSRLALYLQTQHDASQQTLGHQTWESPAILSLNQWLENTFYQHNKDGLVLLTDFQARCVWEEVIQHSETQLSLGVADTALLAKEAYERLVRWEVPQKALQEFSDQPEVAALLNGICHFENKCTQAGWIVSAKLPALLIQQKIKTDHITLAGFDDLDPSLQRLFPNAKYQTQTDNASTCHKIGLHDTETEICAMAEWAKARLVENPHEKIGCVIPNLNTLRSKVEQIFTRVFCIDNIQPNQKKQLAPFNISAGLPLSDYFMVQTALKLLSWLHKPLPIDALATLLQSPYLWNTEVLKNHHAKIDILLRKKNYLEISFHQILAYFPEWRALLIDTKTKQKPSGWKSTFIDLLKKVHWPAGNTQSSLEYQLLERFKKTLQEFASLDLLFDTISFTKAISLLSNLCHNTLFQAQSHHEPIQIMGALEASSIHFDAAWVMGLDDITWPAPSKPHPLIPFRLQQQYDMPHATAKRELLFSKHMIHRLTKCARTIFCSYPQFEGDQVRHASTLIQTISEAHCTQQKLKNSTSVARTGVQAPSSVLALVLPNELPRVPIEKLIDNKAPPILEKNLKGGTNIIELQALCPFRAFSTVRLKAQAIPSPTLGMPPHQKGAFVHQILFYIWETLKDQTTLLATDDTTLLTLIQTAIEKSAHDLNIPNNYFSSLEKERIIILMQEWLDFEKTRPNFKVLACETETTLTAGNLTIQTRQDRIDELSDGTRVIIDYKTNPQSTTGWFQEALHNLQLPLYASFHTEKPSAICFAEITAAKMQLKGVAHENYKHDDLNNIQKTKNNFNATEWQAILTAWKTQIETLADDFENGAANVLPLKSTTCQTCDLQSLCRYQYEEVL